MESRRPAVLIEPLISYHDILVKHLRDLEKQIFPVVLTVPPAFAFYTWNLSEAIETVDGQFKIVKSSLFLYGILAVFTVLIWALFYIISTAYVYRSIQWEVLTLEQRLKIPVPPTWNPENLLRNRRALAKLNFLPSTHKVHALTLWITLGFLSFIHLWLELNMKEGGNAELFPMLFLMVTILAWFLVFGIYPEKLLKIIESSKKVAGWKTKP